MTSLNPAADADDLDRPANTIVAVVGMSARYANAADVRGYWNLLCAGEIGIHRFEDDDDGVFVHGLVDGAEEFDAAFFSMSPREALIVDPQQRILLQAAYHALEDAGCDAARYPGSIGVYVGGSTTSYAAQLAAAADRIPELDDWQIRLATAPDFLATRVAHRLNLRGPAVTLQTACSTSLVAIHTAVQALVAGECDLALAGGVSICLPVPRNAYRPGGVFSADGLVRPFDASGSGTVAGQGVGVVALKTLEDARADGDHIHALIIGSAMNNDGASKVGFTAPSVVGQSAVVREALAVADVPAETIGYVETHGTGTQLGDPIEIAALGKAFGLGPSHRCWIGSVKPNIGHTDSAAGVAGFIKAVLAVETAVIPPTVNFESPNPEIDFDNLPFRVNTQVRQWPDGHLPRRAGVTALGVGGTNAHVVVQQPSAAQILGRRDDLEQLLVWSARSDSALDAVAANLTAHLGDGDVPIEDVAWTLQRRQRHQLRSYLVTNHSTGLDLCADPRVVTATAPGTPAKVALLFPGQGVQHVDMARTLYESHRGFRRDIDECASLAAPELGLDLAALLYPENDAARAHSDQLMATMEVGQPALFAVEYAIARWWQSLGIEVEAVLGHSVGAYAAACIAGVFSLADALKLVLWRARTFQSLPHGAMAAIFLPEQELESMLPGDLSVAAVNGPDQTTVSGTSDAVSRFVAKIAASGIGAKRLQATAACHSSLVDPVLDEFERVVASVPRTEPTIALISDRTGRWTDPNEITSARYWREHMRETVRFGDALSTLNTIGTCVAVESGPGLTLTALGRRHPDTANVSFTQSLPHPVDPNSPRQLLLGAVGELWLGGVDIRWERLHDADRPGQLVKLPAYPFDRTVYSLRGLKADQEHACVTVSPSRDRDTPDPLPTGPACRSENAVVVRAFSTLLGLNDVTPQANFFELGGDSVVASALVSWIRRELGVELSVRDVFEHPTVLALSAMTSSRADHVLISERHAQ